jgi:hypothetical protein
MFGAIIRSKSECPGTKQLQCYAEYLFWSKNSEYNASKMLTEKKFPVRLSWCRVGCYGNAKPKVWEALMDFKLIQRMAAHARQDGLL